MTNIEVIGLASGGGLVFAALLVAAYLNGHHNGKHSSSDTPTGPRATPISNGQLDPGFILNAIDDGVVMVDSSGAIQAINPAAAQITGREISEIIGLDFQVVLPLVDSRGQAYTAASHPFYKVLATNKVIRDSAGSLVSQDGKQIPISLVVSPAQGGAVGVLRDISRERAEESERTEFISTASHEMRTPLASIEGYLSLALNTKTGKIDTSTRTYLEKAHAATQHLGQLFQDLLTTTRAEDSRLASHPEVVEVGAIIATAVEETKPAADKKGLGLHFLASGETSENGKVVKPLFYVKLDPARLKEVLQNLLDNAVKYTSAGNVTIRLTGDKSVVQIQVSDSGSGIPTEDIPHLFQKFYRVDSSLTRKVGGTGLGLFICRKILELYDGRIWVDSKLGKGSTFFVNLPRLDSSKAVASQSVNGVIQSPQGQA